jgi:catechol 2,3-dioxygenase-like lactoylglutathione lyase family enzyme
MKMNHLHLMVPDVRASAGFFLKYFDLRETSGNAGLAVLIDDDGFVLTLMKAGSKVTKGYPENFHVGFFVADVAPPERTHAYSFYVGAPGGFLVEVGA